MAQETAKEIESFTQKDTLSPQSSKKGVQALRLKPEETGPLIPHKPLGRLLVSLFHCYAYKNMHRANAGIKPLALGFERIPAKLPAGLWLPFQSSVSVALYCLVDGAPMLSK